MKISTIALLAAVLLLGGCYNSPLIKEHVIPIDLAVLGLWGKGNTKDLVILKYSDTEYLIHFLTNRDAVYLRGYPIKLGGISCIQLQVIGTDDGPHSEDKHSFPVVSYRIVKDELEVKLLNTKFVSKELKGSKALREAFLKHKDNKELFSEPMMFHHVRD